MAQTVFNFGYGLSLGDHSNGARVPEAVSRVNDVQSLGTECALEILFTEPVDAMAGEGRSALVDK